MSICPVCEEEMREHNPGVDNWFKEDDGGYIVREMICDNKVCPLYKKQQNLFFDFSRTDVDGDEIDLEELKKELIALAKKPSEDLK